MSCSSLKLEQCWCLSELLLKDLMLCIVLPLWLPTSFLAIWFQEVLLAY